MPFGTISYGLNMEWLPMTTRQVASSLHVSPRHYFPSGPSIISDWISIPRRGSTRQRRGWLCLLQLPRWINGNFTEDTLKSIFMYKKYLILGLNFNESCFPRANLQWFSIGLDNGSVSKEKRQVIIETIAGLVYWRICVSIGLDEFSW